MHVVAPARGRADQRVFAGAMFIGNQPAAAMAADVVERTQFSVVTANDDRPLADGIEGEIVARIGNVAGMAGNLPVGPEKLILLQFQEGVAVLAPGWKSAAIPVFGAGNVPCA